MALKLTTRGKVAGISDPKNRLKVLKRERRSKRKRVQRHTVNISNFLSGVLKEVEVESDSE